MDSASLKSSNAKVSPFPPAADIPLHKNPPLAPSQELAYRQKCIQLKRRLAEIENNNDDTRKRITRENDRIQKMRLLRAVLLGQLRQVMSTSGQKLTPEQLNKLGIAEPTDLEEIAPLEGEGLLDDSSDESEDEDLPEPSERPTRTRRTNNNYRETVMSSNMASSVNAAAYSQPGLPNIAPAGGYSPPAPRDTVVQPSSFHVASTPLAAGSPTYSQHSVQQPYAHDARYPQHSSPIQQHQALYPEPHRQPSDHDDSANGISTLVPPTRPEEPFVQFQNHMRPQLESDNYPAEQIESRILEEWKKLSDENRGLWEARYDDQMLDYQSELEAFRRSSRRSEYR